MLITSENPPQVNLLNVGMLKEDSGKLSPDDRVYLIRYGMKEWIEWEKESKIMYEDAYRNLLDISEIAAAEFIMQFVKDVDKELRDAEFLYRTRDAIDWDLPTIYDKEV